MKKTTLKLLLSAACISALFFLSEKNKSRNENGPLFPETDEGIGSMDDPQARMHFEMRKLVDPATGRLPVHVRSSELAYAEEIAADFKTNFPNAKTASALSWVRRGPNDVGGRTRAFALDIADEKNIIAGCVSGGMWRSIDSGVNWTKTTASFPGAVAVAQDKRAGKTNIWYYTSGESYGTSASGGGAFYEGNGIYKSTDNGVSWTSLTATVSGTPQSFDSPYDATWNIVTDAHDLANDVVYLAAVSGIFKSVNGGTSWTTVLGSFSAAAPYFTDVAITDAGVVYATMSTADDNGGGNNAFQKGIWRCPDGVNWTLIKAFAATDTANRMKIGIDPQNQNKVYILAETPGMGMTTTNYIGTPEQNSFWKYTYVSGDGSGAGGIWDDLSSHLPHNQSQFDNFNSQGGYDLVVKVLPTDSNTVFIGGTNIFRSTDGFTTDNNITQIGGYGINTTYPDFVAYPNHHSDIHEFAFSPIHPNHMYSAADGGMYFTLDCLAPNVVWSTLDTGYVTGQVYTCAVDHGTPNSNIITCGLQDNGSRWVNSASPTANWTFSAKGDGAYLAIADGAGTYYFSRQLGQIIKCTLDANGVQTGFTRIDPIGVDSKDYEFINPFVLDPNNNNIMYLPAGRKLYRNASLNSLPLNNIYDSIATGWEIFPDTTASQISAVAVSKSPANKVFYGTEDGHVYRIDNAHTGLPTRTEITSVGGTQPFQGGYVSCIAVDPSDADKLIVVFSNYNLKSLFYTKDGGLHWKNIGGNLEQNPYGTGTGPSCRWASIMPVNGGNIYLIATSVGLYGSAYVDSTNTGWAPMATAEIGNTVCDYIDTRASDGLVVVCTHGSGVYSTNINDLAQVGLAPIPGTINKTEIKAFPNPFKDFTEISFDLKNATEVSVKVYDLKGNEIRTLTDGLLASGIHRFEVDGKNLSPGVYFCVIKEGTRVSTKKLVFIK